MVRWCTLLNGERTFGLTGARVATAAAAAAAATAAEAKLMPFTYPENMKVH